MVTSSRPAETPSGHGSKKAVAETGNVDKKSSLALFAGAVLDMSWQMALVVLIPIVGGYELDKYLNTLPTLTIIGFVLAMIGSFVVMRKSLLEYGNRTVTNMKDKNDRSTK